MILLVKIKDVKGKKVIAKNGMMIGEVEDIELDENTWIVKTAYVKLEDEVAKLYSVKGGFMTKSVAPLPGSLMGPMMDDKITLKEPIKDVNSLLEQVQTSRSIR